ncbi:MAG: ArgE/DapE family deacylase [Phycisphaerales bacterium]|nr:ArgE/DapE family deacylase [Planctomycetota bacterium]MCH8508907.1 ArgE/DapE family deacylase [Phycisphaerales bacterium]
MDDTRARAEIRALEAIDHDALLERLGAMIAVESVSGEETAAQRTMAGFMRSIGMEVDEWDIDMDTLRVHPSYTAEIERDHAVGVVGRHGSGQGPTLVLNGHVDVVPAGDLSRWTHPPFRAHIENGRVYGRGATDMKGALCCALGAIEAIVRAGVRLEGAVLLQSVVGEEDGGMGTLASVLRGHTGDAGIVLEPTRLAVAPAQAGAMNFRITVPGVAAHGALRAEGIDPVERFIPIFHAVRAFEAERNARLDHPMFRGDDIPFAICVGTVRCGVWASTVAESLVCEGRLGIAPGEAPDGVRAAFVRAVEAAADRIDAPDGGRPIVDWWGAQFMPAEIDPGHDLVRTLAAAHADTTGRAPDIRGMPYGADMRLLVNEGRTPSVLYGPGDVRTAHAPDESVPIADLHTATAVLVRTILRMCGIRA